jgi:hypothetical protein
MVTGQDRGHVRVELIVAAFFIKKNAVFIFSS